MISGKPSTLTKLVAIAALVVIPNIVHARWDQDDLMKEFARIQQQRVEFTETRHIRGLKAPLVVKGVLYYQTPDRLEKHVTTPFEESAIIVGSQATVDNKTQGVQRSFDINSHPALWALAESLRAVLGGNLATLEKMYKVRFDGNREKWQIQLLPSDPEVAKVIRVIVVDGSRNAITRITTTQADGDYSVMALAETRS